LIEFQVHGFESATLRVSRLAAFRADPLLAILGNLLRGQTLRHFDQESGPAGKWADLQPSTIARKRGGQILFDTGRLRGSIGIVAGHNQVEVGTSVAYARFHQHGTRKMVARRFVGLTAADHDEIERTVNAFMTGLIA
jgi:phage virion morphogenesis protein